MKRLFVFVSLALVLLAFILTDGKVSAQTTPTPQVTQFTVLPREVNMSGGSRKNLEARLGVFNINSKVSSTDPSTTGLDFDTLISSCQTTGLHFFGLTDSSTNLTLRTFFLLRGTALAKAALNQVPLTGFRWSGESGIAGAGNVKITVIGADKFTYYSAGGQKKTVGTTYSLLDYINPSMTDSNGTQVYTSERTYVKLIQNGTAKISGSSSFGEITSALNTYLEYWTAQGTNLDVVLGGETLKELRKDMENRVNTVNDSSNIRTPKMSFDDLNSWIMLEGNSNGYMCSMFCYPDGVTDISTWGDNFFKNQYDTTTPEYYHLAEVRAGTGTTFDDTFYRKALQYGWKVGPAVSLNNTDTVGESAASSFTGVWCDTITSYNKLQLMQNILAGIRQRRTFVSSLPTVHPRLTVAGTSSQSNAQIEGDTITSNQPVIIDLALATEKQEDRIMVFKPVLVVMYNDNTERVFPFNSYYQDVTGHGPNTVKVDRLYRRIVDKMDNIRCFYGRVDVYRIMKKVGETTQFDDTWSYYKIWKYFIYPKLTSEHYQTISAPIYVKI
ncbi:MAG: hypothetical protein LWY06_14750 [Firmicutes bacterium]|nr:hypothetical protein [Bacillota bacterium]